MAPLADPSQVFADLPLLPEGDAAVSFDALSASEALATEAPLATAASYLPSAPFTVDVFADAPLLAADFAALETPVAAIRTERRRPDRASGGQPFQRLSTDLEQRGFALHRRIAHPDLPTLDHLVVTASGVWVIAREQVHCARVSVRGRFASRPTLRIAGRDRTSLVVDLDRQLTAVRGLLYDQLDVPVQAALCLPGADFPLLRTLSVGDHLVLRPAQLMDQLGRKGPVKRTRAREVAVLLDRRLG